MSKRLFCGGLAWATTTEDLREAFLNGRDTVAANLLWARPDASSEELREALERADAWAAREPDLAAAHGAPSPALSRNLRDSPAEAGFPLR